MCCNGEGLATSMKREDTCWSPSFESCKTCVFEDMMFPREYDIFIFFQHKWRTLVSSDKITEFHIKLENMSISLIYYGRKGWHLVSKWQLRWSTCWIFHLQSRDTVSRAVHHQLPFVCCVRGSTDKTKCRASRVLRLLRGQIEMWDILLFSQRLVYVSPDAVQ